MKAKRTLEPQNKDYAIMLFRVRAASRGATPSQVQRNVDALKSKRYSEAA